MTWTRSLSLFSLVFFVVFFGATVAVAEEQIVLAEVQLPVGKEVPVALPDSSARLLGWRFVGGDSALLERAAECPELGCATLSATEGKFSVSGRFGAMKLLGKNLEDKEETVALSSLGGVTLKNNTSFPFSVQIIAE